MDKETVLYAKETNESVDRRTHKTGTWVLGPYRVTYTADEMVEMFTEDERRDLDMGRVVRTFAKRGNGFTDWVSASALAHKVLSEV